MQIVFNEARRLLEAGQSFVIATVVATRGSTPQKSGAKLLVRADGSIVGTLGGGCVEADVRIEARRLLAEGGAPSVRRFRLDEDMAARDGLVCGGSMDIFIDPLTEAGPAARCIVDEIVTACEGGGDRALAIRFAIPPEALAQTVELDGAAARARLFVRVDSDALGSLGDPALDAEVTARARELMPRGSECWIDTADGSRVYVEAFTRPARVVIAGGGHVGLAIYTLARAVGFDTVIIDDRPEFANAERFPEADPIVVDAFDRGLRAVMPGPNDYVVVATRGHKQDDLAVREAARSRAGYVGLLGSKRKAVLIARELEREGVSPERIREVRAPVGLDLGGRQPEEIALSILAEIVAERNGRRGAPLSAIDERLVEKVQRSAARETVDPASERPA